jgi:hypothetical protein
MACNDCLVALKGTDSPDSVSITETPLQRFTNSKAMPAVVILGSAVGVYFLAKLLFGGAKK